VRVLANVRPDSYWIDTPISLASWSYNSSS
jgi:hypothetical protein